MKRLAALLLTCLVVSASASAETLVVYFSCTGHTEALAASAADVLDAQCIEIVPAEPYTQADINYTDDACRANREQADNDCRPGIAESIDIEAFDTILLAYPIWWGEEPRILDAFIESVDLSGKRVAAVCTSGGSGIETSYARLTALAPEAEWLGAKRFPADTSVETLTEWLTCIGLK